MDTLIARLEEASHAGDVNLLSELLKKDRLLLERVIASTSVRDTPLHIAAIFGHAAFAHELIRRKPGLAKELNSQGLSPMHLAAAHDHVAVVKELLKSDVSLCLLREKYEGLLPLHVAVIKGRTAVVEVLVEACEEALHVCTNGGETILHLAVKYNTFYTVEFLIERVRDINVKDSKGNTVLHLAMTRKQLSVTKVMLSKPTIDVNAMNLKFSTPLDVLLESQHKHGDLVLGEMIRAAGGKTAAEVLSNSVPVLGTSPTNSRPNTTVPPPRPSLQQPHNSGTMYVDPEEATPPKLQKGKKIKNMNHPDILLLVATLVATVTFQAALSPPGGVQPDDDQHRDTKGQAVLGEGLTAFLILDMFALFSSVSVILLFMCVVPRKRKFIIRFLVWVVWIAAFSMGLAFSAGIAKVYNYDNSNLTTKRMLLRGWLAVLMLGISWVLLRLLFFLLKKSGLGKKLLPKFAKLKVGFSSTWKRINDQTRSSWTKKCCWFLRCVICILCVICVIAVIVFIWYIYAILYNST